MSEHWIQVSEKIIAQLKELESKEGKDRLELVSSLRFVLNVLQRSLIGWVQWVSNPEIMSIFSQTDLEEMHKKLNELTKSFVTYDIEVTKLGLQKGLKAPKKVAHKKREERTERFYV